MSSSANGAPCELLPSVKFSVQVKRNLLENVSHFVFDYVTNSLKIDEIAGLNKRSFQIPH